MQSWMQNLLTSAGKALIWLWLMISFLRRGISHVTGIICKSHWLMSSDPRPVNLTVNGSGIECSRFPAKLSLYKAIPNVSEQISSTGISSWLRLRLAKMSFFLNGNRTISHWSMMSRNRRCLSLVLDEVRPNTLQMLDSLKAETMVLWIETLRCNAVVGGGSALKDTRLPTLIIDGVLVVERRLPTILRVEQPATLVAVEIAVVAFELNVI